MQNTLILILFLEIVVNLSGSAQNTMEQAIATIKDCMDASPAQWPDTWQQEYMDTIRNAIVSHQDSPERFDSGKYEVFGSNGVIGLLDKTNSDANTIIIGRVGSYCGSLYFSKNKCWVTDNAIKANAKETSDPFYLYYLLITQKLNSKAAGSGQPLINQEILNSIDITLPPLPEHRSIVSKLDALSAETKKLESIYH
jgi:restriction endonuclease S subunit